MFTTDDIKNLESRRVRILIPAIAAGLLAMFAYLGLVLQIRDTCVHFAENHFGKTLADATPAVLMLPSVLPFLASAIWAERKAKQYSLKCPDCSYDLSQLTEFVKKTKCCKNCGHKIVNGGKVRTATVFKRFVQMRSRRFLVLWFWAWPALGLCALTCYWLNPDWLENCLHMLVVPGIVGTIATGWTILRTKDRRYLLQAFASAVILIVNSVVFWNAL
jgi:hypothetical protein